MAVIFFWFWLVIVFVLGSVFGSFIGAFTYRWPRGISIFDGRSECDVCKKKISWHDNIPLLSYIMLGGKCRKCDKKISIRYPVIEGSTAIIFSLVYYFYNSCMTGLPGSIFYSELICTWKQNTQVWSFLYFFLIASILIAIFVIDFENRLIPDELAFIALFTSFLILLLSSNDQFYLYLLSGFSASLFLLLINIITLGRGMGLGDVKLALFIGIFLGWQNTILWIFISFVLGAVVGVVLIIVKKAKFGKPIPFGPFLVISFFLILFWSKPISSLLMPYF